MYATKFVKLTADVLEILFVKCISSSFVYFFKLIFCRSVIMVSRSRAFQPNPAAWVERVGDKTSRTLGLTSRLVVAVAC